MRTKLLGVLIACTILMMAGIASAEQTSIDDNPSTARMRLRPNQQTRLLLQLFMAPVYFMAYSSVHEGSHALAGISFGHEVSRFEPYPHRVRLDVDTDGDGLGDAETVNFMFGFIEFEESTREPSQAMIAVTMLAPSLTDFVLFSTADLLLQYVVDPHSAGAPFLLFGGMVAPLVDFFTNMTCLSDRCDLSKFAESSGVPQGVVRLVGFSLAFVAAWRIMHQFRRVFMDVVPRTDEDSRPRQSNRSISFAPLLGEDVVGVGASAIF
ncbi:MAG: hypothetical protein V1738_01180 [Patescibacteria group bacterium]